MKFAVKGKAVTYTDKSFNENNEFRINNADKIYRSSWHNSALTWKVSRRKFTGKKSPWEHNSTGKCSPGYYCTPIVKKSPYMIMSPSATFNSDGQFCYGQLPSGALVCWRTSQPWTLWMCESVSLKPNSITLAASELVRSWFEAGLKLVRAEIWPII